MLFSSTWSVLVICFECLERLDHHYTQSLASNLGKELQYSNNVLEYCSSALGKHNIAKIKNDGNQSPNPNLTRASGQKSAVFRTKVTKIGCTRTKNTAKMTKISRACTENTAKMTKIGRARTKSTVKMTKPAADTQTHTKGAAVLLYTQGFHCQELDGGGHK